MTTLHHHTIVASHAHMHASGSAADIYVWLPLVCVLFLVDIVLTARWCTRQFEAAEQIRLDEQSREEERAWQRSLPQND